MTATEEPPGDADLGPDLALGIPGSAVVEGAPTRGHVAGQPVILVRVRGFPRAVDGLCTHYQGPLADGLVVGDTVRCPWHHARFCLSTGEALGAPATEALNVWRVEELDGTVFVRARAERPPPRRHTVAGSRRVVIVGAGAAGFSVAELLRREGHRGQITLLGDDPDPPYDRPNCSKDYLAGKAARGEMPLKDAAFYASGHIELKTGDTAGAIDVEGRTVTLAGGGELPFDVLVLATGAAPIRPPLPGFDRPEVHVLRTLRDCEAIIAAAGQARRVAVVGASFIGLEVAAAMVERGLEAHVIAPQAIPLARLLGDDLGRHIQSLHEAKGVVFHLGRSARGFVDGQVTLEDGGAVAADFVVVGAGVRPRVELAQAAGLAVDRGVVVDGRFRTAAHNVFAVGDVARYPDPRTGDRIRVEHWVAAERQGQHVARVLLGQAGDFTEAPFFWSAHYDSTISYVGHAETFDTAEVEGDIAAGDAVVRLTRGGDLLAVASLGRDIESLKAELAFEA